MWASTVEQIQCDRYLCPATLDCVERPMHCPCPSPEDIKCIIPDHAAPSDGGTVVCVRGEGCKGLEKKYKP